MTETLTKPVDVRAIVADLPTDDDVRALAYACGDAIREASARRTIVNLPDTIAWFTATNMAGGQAADMPGELRLAADRIEGEPVPGHSDYARGVSDTLRAAADAIERITR